MPLISHGPTLGSALRELTRTSNRLYARFGVRKKCRVYHFFELGP